MTRLMRRIRAVPGADKDRSGVIKRSLSIAGHATSISLEEPFWNALKSLASARGISLATLAAEVDGKRGHTNLSSALRVHVLENLTAQVEALRQSKGPEAGPDSAD
jgi:predicted DNA-binding ribbon-helix-helix protein